MPTIGQPIGYHVIEVCYRMSQHSIGVFDRKYTQKPEANFVFSMDVYIFHDNPHQRNFLGLVQLYSVSQISMT